MMRYDPRGILPCSTSFIAQAAVIALVIEAIHTTVSVVIGVPAATSRMPKAPSKITPSTVPAAATTPGISPPFTALRSGAASALVSTIGFLPRFWTAH